VPVLAAVSGFSFMRDCEQCWRRSALPPPPRDLSSSDCVQVLQFALTRSDLIGVQVLPFRYPAAHQLMYMPMWDPNAESLVTGPSQDDHDGGPAAGVASGFDPSGGEPCYQFGNQWVSWHDNV
jgi:hypothetical protein